MTTWTPPSGSVPGANLRVSDAERAQVADALSKHFADGRLDQAEFDDRIQQAMSAKTRVQLAGLFDDLPPLAGTPLAAPETRRRRGGFSFMVVTMVIFLAAFWAAAWSWHFPWLLFGVIFLVFWARSRRCRHRHGPWAWHGHSPAPGETPHGSVPLWVHGRRQRRWM